MTDPYYRPHYQYDPNQTVEYYEREYAVMQQQKSVATKMLEDGGAASNAADFFEWAVDKYTSNLLIYAVDHTARYTYSELDQCANRIAHWAIHQNLAPSSVVCLLMENRPEYLCLTMGLAKAGLCIALINTNLTGDLLRHAITTANATCIIISTAKKSNWESIESHEDGGVDVWWYAGQGFDVPVLADSWFQKRLDGGRHKMLDASLLNSYSHERVPRTRREGVNVRDPLYYIFTSGTTGPSKAAKFSHKRWIGCALTWSGPSGLKEGDRYYISLPLYHGNAGAVAMAPCILLGNTVVLREKFSASSFFKDVREHQCVATVYVGELWRYLHLQQPQPTEGTPQFSPLRVIIGNGLRSDLFESITKRFHITQVVEHYGATEMPGDAIQNYFNKPGSCGFLPKSVATAKASSGEGGILVQYDVENDAVVRVNGRCVVASSGETGEMIMRLPDGKYDGYVGDAVTRRKLYTDVFAEGDCWWSSGDLLTVDDQGFFYFQDRGGDSMRWKSENISSNDVGQVVGAYPHIREANVYGIKIPNTDGRAPMASVLLNPDSTVFNFEDFTLHIQKNLPSYSRPLFLRFRAVEHDKTSTLKFQKFKYAQQGYDPSRTEGDDVYLWEGKSWIQVNDEVVRNINDGRYRF
ncbi:hypothetical protein SmJEL517_g03660 [Synchytrium microbalum]|uniref:AMP-dependent synthetase/ligase domain-containing protein n=1 Tax=Synchytrium microbalum TaxID=1806994 RepID=A0A507BXJ4_9FUNG|nr:uncharacterized protein SmJEL517_g03660 [Synchytrium microbalum]TPX33507.1 hypothetical protein SmJEL517_g03660 [Synchytrium microbalum]